jgi:hypothetical protein
MIALLQTQELDQIGRTLGGVEIGLRRGCPDECHAHIDRHFVEEPPLTWESNVAEFTDLGPRLINALQSHDINTAGELRKAVWDGRVISIPNVGTKELQRCIRVLDSIGRLVMDWCI